MVLPIVCYGNNVLKKLCHPISPNDSEIEKLITDMWETLEVADGCGLAAPQVNIPVKLFIVNSRDTYLNMNKNQRREYFDGDEGVKETFINAEIIEYVNDLITIDDEGCLSIPNIYEAVKRPWKITIKYHDAQFQEHIQTFSGYTARVIQHEYDHTMGVLYTELLNPLRKQLLRNKLSRIQREISRVKYPMIK